MFCTVGASGYFLNLGVFLLMHKRLGLGWYPAETISFIAAASSNYVWNRIWTFRDQRSHFALQGMRFFVVSVLAYSANSGFDWALIKSGLSPVSAQALGIILVTPVNFVGNKLWSFRE